MIDFENGIERLVFVDIETTGTNPLTDQITEIGALVFENGKFIKKFSTLINPQTEIPYFIQNLTGINDSMVRTAPKFEEVADELLSLLEGNTFVAHNVMFDYKFIVTKLAQLGKNIALPHLCTVKLSRALYPQERRHGLDYVIERCQINCDARHRAFDDAQAVAQFYALAKINFHSEIFQKALKRALRTI